MLIVSTHPSPLNSNYALRKIRAEFRTNKTLTDAAAVQDRYAFAQTSLATVRRQVSSQIRS